MAVGAVRGADTRKQYLPDPDTRGIWDNMPSHRVEVVEGVRGSLGRALDAPDAAEAATFDESQPTFYDKLYVAGDQSLPGTSGAGMLTMAGKRQALAVGRMLRAQFVRGVLA